MTVFAIRAFSRFAMRQPVRIVADCGQVLRGLLIELSGDGCRLGGIDPDKLAMDQTLVLHIGRRRILAGTVRWKGEGRVGLKLERPLTRSAMEDLLSLQGGPLDHRRFGT